jgi:hypothetical protein
MLLGHTIVQASACTIAVAVEVLSWLRSSLVSLVAITVLEIAVPSPAPASTWYVNLKTALEFAGRLAIVQVEVPTLPGLGFTQVAGGPSS